MLIGHSAIKDWAQWYSKEVCSVVQFAFSEEYAVRTF